MMSLTVNRPSTAISNHSECDATSKPARFDPCLLPIILQDCSLNMVEHFYLRQHKFNTSDESADLNLKNIYYYRLHQWTEVECLESCFEAKEMCV